MDCTQIEHLLEIFHNLSIAAVLLTTFYFGSKQVNRKELHPELLVTNKPKGEV
jgi:hypothetical protein